MGLELRCGLAAKQPAGPSSPQGAVGSGGRGRKRGEAPGRRPFRAHSGVGLTPRPLGEYYCLVPNNHSTASVLRRRDAILRLVREEVVRSQEELQRLLAERGFEATQPTLSRDVRELGLVKTPGGYALQGTADRAADAAHRVARLQRTLSEAVLSVRVAGSLVVLRTPPAGAHPVARAVDEAELAEAIGTIAGDDTVFVATPGAVSARALAARLGGPHAADRRHHA